MMMKTMTTMTDHDHDDDDDAHADAEPDAPANFMRMLMMLVLMTHPMTVRWMTPTLLSTLVFSTRGSWALSALRPR